MTSAAPACSPEWAVPGGDITITGIDLPLGSAGPPRVTVGDVPARVRSASASRLTVTVPAAAAPGSQPVVVDGATLGHVLVAAPVATGVHMVDSPAFDQAGRLYATHSGTRGVKVPVPLFRVRPDGGKDPLAVDISNATSVVAAPDGALFVSSRFDGHVHRVSADESVEVYATELGVPTGLALAPDGTLFVGDRSGSVLRVTPERHVETFATLPASVAAFHLALDPSGALYVSAPTLSSHDVVYRITPDRLVEVVADGFGRPQGLAFDQDGLLYVADALAGSAGVYRIDPRVVGAVPERLLAAAVIVGVAFDPNGGLVVAASDAIWRLDVPLRPPIRPPVG